MYIEKIKDFLPNYDNIDKNTFFKILSKSNNKWFFSILFEKDFLLTLILIKFWEKFPDLIFKWWTCLNKVYFPYFRLSEDLDFVLDASNVWRQARKTLLKKYEKDFVETLWILGLKLQTWRTKFDEHKLAMFNFEYNSILDNSKQNIKIDISLKNNLVLKPQKWEIKSIFKDIIFEEDIFWKHTIKTMNLKEMLAEKIRAALTRSTPAIRDFFDIWYVKNNSDFNFEDIEFKKIVDLKLKEVDYKYSLEENYDLLVKQIETDLKPVLNQEFNFNFNKIYNFILTFKSNKWNSSSPQ